VPLIKTEVVVGEVTTQVLVVSDTIKFCTPVFKLVEERTDVSITDCRVCDGKVIFNGELQKNIIYKAPPTGCDCREGPVVYHELVLPFAGFVEVPGALPGDRCQVESAGVRDLCNFFIPLTRDEKGFITCAQQKTVVDVTLKVVRVEQLDVAVVGPVVDPCNPCRP
jgi:hypothetical protein